MKKAANPAITHYEVTYCTCVDYPERRGPSFPVVHKGHRSVANIRFSTQGAATRYYEGILQGASDFSSEYVCWVEVVRWYTSGPARYVRKRVDRPRPARWVFDHNPAPTNAKGWSCNDGSPCAFCEVCAQDLVDKPTCEHVDQAAMNAWLALGEVR